MTKPINNSLPTSRHTCAEKQIEHRKQNLRDRVTALFSSRKTTTRAALHSKEGPVQTPPQAQINSKADLLDGTPPSPLSSRFPKITFSPPTPREEDLHQRISSVEKQRASLSEEAPFLRKKSSQPEGELNRPRNTNPDLIEGCDLPRRIASEQKAENEEQLKHLLKYIDDWRLKK